MEVSSGINQEQIITAILMSSLSSGLCAACLSQPGDVAYTLMGKYRKMQGRRKELHRMCTSCSATPCSEEVACDSIDCSVLYARKRTEEEEKDLKAILKKLDLM